MCIHVFIRLLRHCEWKENWFEIWEGRVSLPVLPGVLFLQVDQNEVTFRKRCTEEKLEDLVSHKLYPPAIHCSVVYSRSPDYEQPSLDILEVKMTGTNKPPVSFLIKVYSPLGKCTNFGGNLLWQIAQIMTFGGTYFCSIGGKIVYV